METAATNHNVGPLGASSQRFARRLFTIGKNRLELLLVEVQEERTRLVRTLLLALGAAILGLLAAVVFTALIVVLFWPYSPVLVLAAVTAVYAAGAGCLYWRLTGLLRNWKLLAATFDQFRKDCACFGKNPD